MMKVAPNSPKTVLDIGIGSGMGGKIVKKYFPETQLYGIEAVGSRARVNSDYYAEIRYGSILDSQYSNETFDLILAAELIEHINVSEIEDFLHEVFRLLKHDGVFILTTPNPNSIKMKMLGGSVLGRSHLSQHFIRETKQRLKLSSFRVKKCLGTGKASLYIGRKFPKIFYGSFMIVASKS